MKIVFDLDGVVCTNTWGDYEKAQPIQNTINMINALFDQNYEITIYSARGFGTCNGDLEKIYKMWYDFTVRQLKTWGLKYHKLLLGKPDADLYVDDRAFRLGPHDELCELVKDLIDD